MYIITVAPLTRGVPQGEFDYFSKEPLSIGLVIFVPIRSREIPAIVLDSKNASDSKGALRSSDYTLRKIINKKPRQIWLPAFLDAIQETADISVKKFGETLFSLTPKTILDAHFSHLLPEPKESDISGRYEALAIQGNTKIRNESYQRLVREAFARNESVFICVPTEEDVKRVTKEIGHGIENYTFQFHQTITKKNILEQWKKVTKEKHAVLVIGTVQYLAIPRYFKTIILDEENSHSWRMFASPLLDLRIFVEQFARKSKSTLLIGASILRAETHQKIKNGEIDEYERISFRAFEEIDSRIIDPRIEEKTTRDKTGKRILTIITSDLYDLIQKSLKEKKNIFLLTARRGLAPITNCADCGTLVKCPECSAPLVVHKKELHGQKSQIFICHGCGFMRAPENNTYETCSNCGSWKLQGVGIGIELVEDEIKKLFPETQPFILDSGHAQTKTQAKKIITQFEKAKGSILVGTQMAIPLLSSINNTAIVSMDSLFAIPDIRMSERIFAIILALREKTTDTLLIQTRNDDLSIFKQALSGNLIDFSESELELRKKFFYPPFGVIIKITLRGKKDEIVTEMSELKMFLEGYEPIIPGNITKESSTKNKRGNNFRMHMILKLTPESWPNSILLEKLRSLPPRFTVEINPDHLL